jgi:hypothetical protein|tara:strand:- start:256 stop:615 length:360 start_codon:yes stop_codon:yes gene_type:complete
MSKGTRRYHKRSKRRGKRRHKKGGNVLSRALVPAALYFSQKRLQRSKRKRSRKNRSRRGGNLKGGSPLSPAPVGVGSGSKNNVANLKFKKNLGGSVLGGVAGGNVDVSLKGGLRSNLLQ